MAVILAIEDNPLVLVGMTMLLESWGHQVIGAASSEEALEQVQGTAALDAIIADYRLNDGGTGVDAVRAVNRITGRHVPAVIVTGENIVADVESLGLPVLRKPISPERLRSRLAEAIGCTV